MRNIINKPSRIKSGCLALVAIFVVLAVWPAGFELTIRPLKGGEPLLRCAIQPGEHFTLHYQHSVSETPIWEVHTIDREGTILIKEERFLAFSAGMGHWPGHGTLTVRGRFQVIENINKPIGDFVLRIAGEKSRHTIIHRHRETDLSRMAAGEAVRVSTEPVTLLTRLLQRRPSGLPAFGRTGDH